MKNIYYFFRQIGENATDKDERIMSRECTAREAQETCTELNKSGTAYYYFMEKEEVERPGMYKPVPFYL